MLTDSYLMWQAAASSLVIVLVHAGTDWLWIIWMWAEQRGGIQPEPPSLSDCSFYQQANISSCCIQGPETSGMREWWISPCDSGFHLASIGGHGLGNRPCKQIWIKKWISSARWNIRSGSKVWEEASHRGQPAVGLSGQQSSFRSPWGGDLVDGHQKWDRWHRGIIAPAIPGEARRPWEVDELRTELAGRRSGMKVRFRTRGADEQGQTQNANDPYWKIQKPEP